MNRVPMNTIGLPETVWWDSDELYLLDQTELPGDVWAYHASDIDHVFDAILTMKVRGAPAIGVAAAYGLLVDRPGLVAGGLAAMRQRLRQRHDRLVQARPTAVNLAWALGRMIAAADSFAKDFEDHQTSPFYTRLVDQAKTIHTEDRQMCQAIGQHGRPLIHDGSGVLTHCNAGSLATSEFGTATSPMYAAHADGIRFRAYADETRPRLQGAKLTAWELHHSGIETTLICDNMAASLMAEKKIDVVIVGSDRVAADGSFANKIGTLPLAIVAKHYGVPFYVAFPSSTIDVSLASGSDIPIEYRDAREVTHIDEHRIAPEGIQTHTPAFDVTPANLVTGYLTEDGLFDHETFASRVNDQTRT